MAIYRLLEKQAFEPELVATMAAAYEQALQALEPLGVAEEAGEIVAKRVIEFAQRGERDLDRLCQLVIRSFTD